MSALVVLTTLSNKKQADHLARKVVESKKAACVQIVPGIISYYRWKGRLEKARETLLLIKTVKSAWPRLSRFLKENHPYEVPEILALPVSEVFEPYLAWLRKSCAILCFAFTATLFVTSSAVFAEEHFVSYKEAQKIISESPQDKSSISVDDLLSKRQNNPSLMIFDARTKAEYDHEHIAGAKLPASDDYYQQMQLFHQKIIPTMPDILPYLKNSSASLAKDTPIVTYCNRNCGLSKALMIHLQSLGFTNVLYLAGGVDTWREKRYPLEVQSS